MRYEIEQPGAFALIKVMLDSGESMKAESDAMVSMSANVKISSKMEGGVLGGLGRMFLSNESAFFQTLTAQGGAGEVLLAPAVPGDVEAIEMQGEEVFLQQGAFLAAENGISIETKMQNLGAGLFSGAGLFITKATGHGNLFINAFGALEVIELANNQEWIIDTGHLVAWSGTTSYTIEKASEGFINSFTSGEMLVCRFKGPGLVIIQSRNPGAFSNWASKFIPKSTGSAGGGTASGVSQAVNTISSIFK